MAFSTAIDCPSLEHTGLDLSTTNTSAGTTVRLSCDDFGHQPSDDTDALICLTTGNWSSPVPSCEWSWDFSTRDKIIFGTSVSAVAFIIVVVIIIIIAYFNCYKKRRLGAGEEKLYESSYHSSSPQVGHTGPYYYTDRGIYPDSYLAYQDFSPDKLDVYHNGISLDKPWLGYIPRPKVSEDRFYN